MTERTSDPLHGQRVRVQIAAVPRERFAWRQQPCLGGCDLRVEVAAKSALKLPTVLRALDTHRRTQIVRPGVGGWAGEDARHVVRSADASSQPRRYLFGLAHRALGYFHSLAVARRRLPPGIHPRRHPLLPRNAWLVRKSTCHPVLPCSALGWRERGMDLLQLLGNIGWGGRRYTRLLHRPPTSPFPNHSAGRDGGIRAAARSHKMGFLLPMGLPLAGALMPPLLILHVAGPTDSALQIVHIRQLRLVLS